MNDNANNTNDLHEVTGVADAESVSKIVSPTAPSDAAPPTSPSAAMPPADIAPEGSAKACDGNGLRQKGGAPLGNTNAWKRGRRTMRVGKLPGRLAYLEHNVHRLAKAVWASLAERGVRITLAHEVIVNAAQRHEQAALIAQFTLRNDFDSLSPAARIEIANSITASTEARDKKLAALGFALESTSKSAASSIADYFRDGHAPSPHVASACERESNTASESNPAEHASGATPGDLEGMPE